MSQFTGSTFGNHAGRWLVVVGIFELALAAVFVFLAVGVPLVRDGMLLTALILGLTGGGLLVVGARVRRSAAADEQLARSGIPGQASVAGLTQTGMYLNENPQVAMDLQVELPGRAPYLVRRKEFVPLILLGRLTSGVPLPVRADAADPRRLIIDWPNAGLVAWPATGGFTAAAATPALPDAAPTDASGTDESLAQVQAALRAGGAPVAAAFASLEQGGYTVEQLRAFLRQSGLQASARIDQVMDMGQVVGDEKLFTMQVTLDIPGRPPEQLRPSAAMVPLTAAPKVKIGWRVPVRVAAENHQLMMFEWEKV